MKKRVLVFPCGSEIGLEVYRAVKYCKDFVLIGGNSVDDHGRFVYENYIDNIPFVDDELFIEKVNKIVEDYKVDLIVPAHDSVVLKLAQNFNKINATVITSSQLACEICRSKKKTYDFFKNILPIPKIYSFDEVNKNDFPLFLKPDVGQGAKGTKKVNNIEELKSNYKDDHLILEFLPGDEYTIDCFTNYKGELIYCSGRERVRISNGISVNCKEIVDDEFLQLAQKINETLEMNGAWFFQLKRRENGELVLMEIATRIAGTMEFQRGYGVNLALLSLYNSLLIDVSIIKNDYQIEFDRALAGSFKLNIDYDTVYIDFDDTIILNQKVNTSAISYLYKCLNENKKIILLTRHKKDILESITRYKIGDIFDEIINIEKNQTKSMYIKQKKSIFIDDSFRERKDVHENCKIPVFDTDMLDFL